MIDYEKLKEYQKLKEEGVISSEEFEAIKTEILNNMTYNSSAETSEEQYTNEDNSEPKYKPHFEKMRKIFSAVSVSVGNVGFYGTIIGGFALLVMLIAGLSGDMSMKASLGASSVIMMIYLVVAPAIVLGITGIVLGKIAMRTPTYYEKAHLGVKRSILSIVLSIVLLVVFISALVLVLA